MSMRRQYSLKPPLAPGRSVKQADIYLPATIDASNVQQETWTRSSGASHRLDYHRLVPRSTPAVGKKSQTLYGKYIGNI